MATPYALRYTLIDAETDAGVLRWITQKSPGHLVIQHPADEDVQQDHWHALLWVNVKLDALRKNWSKLNPNVRGNQAYSLTEIKAKGEDDPVEAYERYMCHAACEGSRVHVVSSSGIKYTEEWFVEQNQAFYAKRKEYKATQAKKAEAPNLVNQLFETAFNAGLTDRRDIALALVRMYAKQRRPLNTFYARSVVNTVWVLVHGREAEQALVDEICR